MAYYAMLHIVDGWDNYNPAYVAITEIEAYNGATKVFLSAIYATSEYINEYASLSKTKLVDGNNSLSAAIACWCSAPSSTISNQYLILRASAPFNSVRVYNGGQGTARYCAKNIRLLTQSATSDPAYNDANWVLQKTDTWPQALAYYDNSVSFTGTAKYFPQCL